MDFVGNLLLFAALKELKEFSNRSRTDKVIDMVMLALFLTNGVVISFTVVSLFTLL